MKIMKILKFIVLSVLLLINSNQLNAMFSNMTANSSNPVLENPIFFACSCAIAVQILAHTYDSIYRCCSRKEIRKLRQEYNKIPANNAEQIVAKRILLSQMQRIIDKKLNQNPKHYQTYEENARLILDQSDIEFFDATYEQEQRLEKDKYQLCKRKPKRFKPVGGFVRLESITKPIKVPKKYKLPESY